MRMRFFGDSYDVVKRFLRHTLAPEAKWVAFPMFTHEVTAVEISDFEAFLSMRVVSPKVLTSSSNREAHFSASARDRHIFIDPDTGIKLKPSKRADAAKYVFGPELVALCAKKHDRLLLVFDQSVPRGSERDALIEKLDYFRENGLSGFAYLSHACFLVLSRSSIACILARKRLLATHLPQTRLVSANNA